MPAPSIVLFDLGNVLVHIDLDAFWCSVGLNKRSEREPFFERYEMLTRQYETGLISTDTFLNHLYNLFAKKYSLQQLRDSFNEVITNRPVEGMVDLVKELARTKRTALVSNTNELHYVRSCNRLESLRILHTHYLSYQLKVMKPDTGFYESIIADMHIDPAEMIFIDDLEANVDGARKSGMQGIQFKDVQQLRQELQQRGIL